MSRRWPVVAIFILSGAAGLVYEVVWARQLVLVFGNTTQAVSAILTGFFGGIAIGSVIGGRLADRTARPLRMYGLLELVLVVVVVLTPVTFRLVHDVYRGAFTSLEAAPRILSLVRFGLSVLALAPATILMGATLPTLTRYLARGPAELSSSFGRLYAANTVGAIIGTVASGFFLIELLGLTGTLLIGAACSGLAGVSALVLDRAPASTPHQSGVPSAPARPEPSEARLPVEPLRPRVRLALIVAFISGLTSLGYQVLWTRLLASGTGDSTYVFTAILAIFLVGLALGALAFNVYRTRIPAINLLALGQVLTALFALLGIALVIARGVGGLLRLTTDFGSLFTEFALPVAVVVLPATFIMGLTFPIASILIADSRGRVGSNAGLLLSANTVGAILGTFAIPFALIPLVGSSVAVGLVALVNAATGIGLAFAGRIEARLPRSVTGGLGVLVAGAIVLGLTSGRVFMDPNVVRIRAWHGTLAASAEDEIAAVQAGTLFGHKQLWVTGTSMTALTVDAKLMPILPLMLRPGSSTALVVAFGMGSAYRGALNAGLRTTAVELVPSVPRMFGVFYQDAPSVLTNPNGSVVIADGRNHIELTGKQYDIIVVDPPPPIEAAGVSVISSLEFYRAARDRLTSGGVMMQWIPYGQTLDEFKAHVRTYAAVFPNTIIAFGPGGNGLFMLGSERALSFDKNAIEGTLRRARVVEDLSSADDSPEHDLAGWAARVPSLVWLRGRQAQRFGGTGPLITDDRPAPEYFLLRHLFERPSPRVSQPLLESQPR